MARTDKLEQSRIMLQAGQSGQSAKQRAQESAVAERQGERRMDISEEQSNLNRQQRQWEQTRSDRARREQDLARRQAGKPRTTNFGGEGYDPNAQQQPDAKLEESKRQFDVSHTERQRQFDVSTDLAAAKSGLQQGGTPGAEAPFDPRPGLAEGEQGPVDPRLLQLQRDMARGREQMNAGLESRGRRGFVATPEAEAAGRQEAGMSERAMQVKELEAAAKWQSAVTSHGRLLAQENAAKSGETRATIRAKRLKVEESLMQPIKSSSAKLDRMMKGEGTEADWQSIESMLSKVPPVGNARASHEELAAREFGPALVRFIGEKVAANAVQYIYATGKLPDGGLVDFSSAGMQEFSQRAIEARQQLLPNTVAGQLLTDEEVGQVKRGWADHLLMVHKLAALLVMKKQKAGGVMPSAAMSAQQEPTHEQRRVDPSKPTTFAEEYGQITPEEAGRRAEEAGGTAAPKTGLAPITDPNPEYPSRGSVSGRKPSQYR
jgi:hypothetical protein